MPEAWIRTSSTATEPVYSVATVNPAVRGVYLHSLAAVPGTVASNTFITLFNPVGSGRTLSFGTVAISSTNTSPSTEVTPLRGHRISTAPTGGTLIAASALARFDTTQVNPTGALRVDNPTVALGAGLFNVPPLLDNRSSDVHNVDIPPGAGPFLFRPGEGIAINKAVGVTSTTWNITLVWAEL